MYVRWNLRKHSSKSHPRGCIGCNAQNETQGITRNLLHELELGHSSKVKISHKMTNTDFIWVFNQIFIYLFNELQLLHKFHVECWWAKLLLLFSFDLIMVLNLSLAQTCRDLVIWKRESYLLIPYLFVHWWCKIVKYYTFLFELVWFFFPHWAEELETQLIAEHSAKSFKFPY